MLGNDLAKVQDLNDITKHVLNVFWGLKPEEQPLRPEALVILKQRANLASPLAHCLPGSAILLRSC